MTTSLDREARAIKIASLIMKRPDLSYTDIGREAGISTSVVARIAARFDIRRERGHNQYFYRKAEPPKEGAYTACRERREKAAKCTMCKILLDHIAEGVALVEGQAVCQTCVEQYKPVVEKWVRPPVDGMEEQ